METAEKERLKLLARLNGELGAAASPAETQRLKGLIAELRLEIELGGL